MPAKMQKEADTGPHDLAPRDQSQHEYRQLDQRVEEMSTLPLRHRNEYELLGMPSRVCATPYGESRSTSLDDLDFPPPPSLDFPPPPPSITASSEHSYLELC
ncbi:hypothetical protein V1264_017200 [Littorina saxatilis]|uniref:Uncharacterized protein n=2 Tax=Littorina saxatilis TaxID=31220 RepID=A0AAN9BIP1_9CAEN